MHIHSYVVIKKSTKIPIGPIDYILLDENIPGRIVAPGFRTNTWMVRTKVGLQCSIVIQCDESDLKELGYEQTNVNHSS